MGSTLTVCETCRGPGWAEGDARQGEALALLAEAAAEGTGVAVRRTQCLMGCEAGCNAAVQGAGKLAYVLGRFEPTAEAAGALVAFAALHGAGHLPSEESGLADLDRALRDYLDELGLT